MISERGTPTDPPIHPSTHPPIPALPARIIIPGRRRAADQFDQPPSINPINNATG
jgi:hypothetical protein